MDRVRRAKRDGGGALLVALGLATLAFAPAACSEKAPEHHPDVVLVTIDTLRADRLSFLGGEREIAPFLAHLADESVVCTRARSSSSWTAPATASIFTGVYPDRHGLIRGLVAQKLHGQDPDAGSKLELHGIRPTLATLPELFAKAGYKTFGVASNPNVDEGLGFTRGFDRFACRPRADADELLGELDTWGDEIRAADPAFVYLHLNDVHAPHEPRAPWYTPADGETPDPLRAYESEISWLDQRLAQVFERYGWEQDAVVMVVSDHGEEFGDHGGEGHRYSLYDELNHVVFLFRSPRAGFAPARVSQPVSLIDALPTLLDLAGVAPPRDLDGRSVAALGDPHARARLERDLTRRMLFAHRTDYGGDKVLWAATDGAWKLIEEEGGDGGEELFDLATDPGEHAPLAPDADPRGAQLAEALGRLQARAASLSDYDSVEIDLDAKRAADLRALGYIEDK